MLQNEQAYNLPLDDHGQRITNLTEEINAGRNVGRVGVSLVPLDFNKLKIFFKNENSNETHICATLQALRWRLTRVSPSMRR